MITTFYPTLLAYSPLVQGNSGFPLTCQLAPNIGSLMLVNDGGQGWGDQVNNVYFVGYKSDPENTDIIGNFSANQLTWTPALSGTDPPSHYVFAVKDFTSDCTFYPAFNSFNGYFAMAWLETTPTGRLNLKYTDVPQGPNAPPINNQLPAPENNNSNQNIFYAYPRILSVLKQEKYDNIPLTDIMVKDIMGNTFKLDTGNIKSRGGTLNMQYPVQSFNFTQTFRQLKNNITGALTTLPTQANDFTTSPLPLIAINIYFGHGTNLLKQRLTTDEKGMYSITLPAGQFTFEIISQNTSINVAQQIF